jgi:hypothetical protein
MAEPRKQREVDASRQCVAVGECRPPHRSKKDTRRWCRGKVGVEHQWAWVRRSELPNAHILSRRRESDEDRRDRIAIEGLGKHEEVHVCRSCGKQPFEWRDVCHCGVVMVDVKSEGERYGHSECPSCGYDVRWRHKTRWINRKWVLYGEPRPKCACELPKRKKATA